MTKLTYADMVKGLNDLNSDELRSLNKILITVCRNKARVERVTAATKTLSSPNAFMVGDILSFFKTGSGRHAGINYFVFEKLNRNGDCYQGTACDENGRTLYARWTVLITQESLKLHMRGGKKV